ncbi:MAG TPA: DUF5916 domain-containing protein [Chitinophagaceae bacterium]|jgi:hypothetical protein|nr:DUF5916 domain-containing protein [Chitinophagaceae bacterium]
MYRFRLLALVLSVFCCQAQAQGTDTSIRRKQYHTQRLTGTITLDGQPNEAAWDAVEWGGDFTQYMPNEGKQPAQPSFFKILYDNQFLYVAYRCLDVSQDSIIRRMGRRDEFPGDWIEINIDSYHDLRTAFSFTLSVSGVRSDEFVSNDGSNWDASWNPIWFAKTNVTDEGWTGEVKIPLSQLRYGNEPEKVWGIQVHRRLFRKEERSTWQYIPQNSGVWVSRFGELRGLNDIPLHRQVEIAPYVTTQLDSYKKEPGNPFASGKDWKVNAGLDGKFAVTNDLILDFTINPDFGQVEADPSQVRIDGFQNFFEERRPFFIESRNIFDYRLTGSEAGGDYDSDLLFYSRRIGSSPHGSPRVGNGEYMRYPQNTSILGAAKFSGKTKDGWSIGVLESVTQREQAVIDKNGQRREELVEPLTNYFVGRLQKDIHSGNTIIGGILTGVNREKGLDNLLHRNAYSGGIDFLHYWKKRTWYVRGNVVFSQVQGTKEAILNTQTAFEHLFQRADAPEVSVDSSRTSLSGMGGTVRLGKIGGKSGRLGQVFKFETGVTLRSPGLELNDIGFLLSANEINHFTWMGFDFQKSFSVFRRARVNYNHWSRWDYGGKFLYQAFNMNAHANFNNNWQTGTGFTWNPYDVSNNALRGTTALRRPPGMGNFFYLTSDTRKKFFVNLSSSTFWAKGKSVNGTDISLDMNYQPVNALRISLSPGYGYNYRKQDQFVSTVSYNNTSRTIVGQVKQRTIRVTARVNYNITPDLTVQYYGQPFITRPLYDRFGYVSAPMARQYDDRFTAFAPGQVTSVDGQFLVDENGDGTTDYQFGRPDFNFVQFRSNLVLRWEYRPGSEFYLVWAQGNSPNAFGELDTPLLGSLAEHAFGEGGRNSFLMKWTYRFLR